MLTALLPLKQMTDGRCSKCMECKVGL